MQFVLWRLRDAWRSPQRAGGLDIEGGGEGDIVVTSIIHNSIAKETEW